MEMEVYMKRKYRIIMDSVLVVITFAAAIFCFFLYINGKGKYKEISYEELQEKFDSKESFVLTIESATCSACQMFKGDIEKITSKYGVIVYYIDEDKLSEEEQENIDKTFDIEGTPTTVNIVNGKELNIYSRIVGADYMATKQKLIKWGYIEEE